MQFRTMLPVVAVLAAIVLFSSQTADTPSPSEPQASPAPSTETAVPSEQVQTSLDSPVPVSPAIDLKSMDFSNARVSLAGPAALYFRNVKNGDQVVSLLFKRDAEGTWSLDSSNSETDNIFAQEMIFDFARLETGTDGTLTLNGILLNGQAYHAKIQLQDGTKFRMESDFQTGQLIGSSLERLRNTARTAYKGELDDLDQTRRINQELLAKIGNLDSGTAAESPAVLELKDQVAQLGTRNESLNSELAGLKVELDKVKEENRVLLDYKNSASVATAIPAAEPVAGEQPGQPAQKSDIQLIDASIKNLSKKVDDLSSSIQQTQGRIAAGEVPVATDQDIVALKAEIKRLSDANESLMAERNRIEQQIRESFLKEGYLATLKPQLKTKVLDGFAGAKPRIGTWKSDANGVRQTDPRQYFAQLDLPLKQEGKTMLYHFKAKSTGKDWVGLGLHIVASKNSKVGYGNGESLLVWLTRDKEYYRNNNTYLQLYRSDDDVNMGRVLDAAISDPVSKELDVQVLYQPQDEYITIAVNGVEKIRYKTWFGITQGVEVSLRALDTASFTGLEVLSE